MVNAVIFDMDGVIIDSEPVHFESDKLTMKDFGIEISDSVLTRYVGVSNPEMWEELRIEYDLSASVPEILKKQNQYKNMLFGSKSLTPIDGIADLLAYLKESGIRTGLASSSPRPFIELILRKLGITDYFEAVVSGEEVERGKPEPDIFLKACELLQTAAEECLVIEDSEHGVKAARAAGMMCLGYRNPNSGNQDLSPSHAVIDQILEAEEIIRRFR